MLAAMAVVLFSWCLLIIAFCGLGYAIFAIFRFELEDDRFFYAFWTGFCLVLFFLQLWHLALPVNEKALLLILLTGVCGFALTFRECAADLRKFLNVYHLLLVAGLAVFLSNRALAPIKLSDAGLYHLTAIQWNSFYPIIPGLGNLIDRMGANDSYFLYHAFLEPVPFVRSFHLANGLLLFVLLLQMAVSLFRAAGREARITDWFLLILMPAAFGQMLDHAEDTSPDLPIFIYFVLIGAKLCASLFGAQTQKQKAFDVFYISCLAATAVSMRVSAVAFGFAAALIVLWRYKSGVVWLSPALCVFVVWIFGNIILTGYPFYPSSLFPFPVDWKVPETSVEGLAKWISSWARQPGGDPAVVLSSWAWLSDWSKSLFVERQNCFEIVFPTCLFIAGMIVSKGTVRTVLWIIAPAIVSILFWFYEAPAPRFAGASFWYLAAGIWAPSLRKARIELKYLCFVLVSAFLAVSRVYYAPAYVRTKPIQEYSTAKTHFATDSGLLLFVPKEGNSCWESPLPCTGYPNPKLKLRSGDDLSRGFAVDRQ